MPRGTLKAKVLRKRPRAGILLRAGRRSVLLTGDATLLDPRRPLSFAGNPVSSALSPFAVQTYSLRNSRELFGFALDAAQLPGTSLPTNLVLAGLEVEQAALLRGATLAGRWGEWPEQSGTSARASAPRGPKLPRMDGVPQSVAGLPRRPGAAVVGWVTEGGPLALPARWDPRARTAEVPAALLDLTGVRSEAPACIAFDVSAGRRPSKKRGLMLRGLGMRRGDAVAIDAERVTYWDGFETGTVAASPR